MVVLVKRMSCARASNNWQSEWKSVKNEKQAKSLMRIVHHEPLLELLVDLGSLGPTFRRMKQYQAKWFHELADSHLAVSLTREIPECYPLLTYK